MLNLYLASSDELPGRWYTPMVVPFVLSIVALLMYRAFLKKVVDNAPTKFKFAWALPLLLAFILAVMEDHRMSDTVLRETWGGGKKGGAMLLIAVFYPLVVFGGLLYHQLKLLPKRLSTLD